MRFEEFARVHGLIVRHLIPHRWVSTPTEDHPTKRNGRYKFLGDVGWVQNWATMDRPEMWRSDVVRPAYIQVRERADADRERQEAASKAASKAGWIMHQTKLGTHSYLDRKGFPDEEGNIWDRDGERLLVIPMRSAGKIVGCQLINSNGEKKFLYGQSTKGASFLMDAKGIAVFCEGYATALSVREAMKAIKVRYSIHVCFSAGNMKDVARGIKGGFVVADHDASGTGQRVALEIEKPYWLGPTIGQDFNDYWLQEGTFRASQSLKKFLTANSLT
jgi:putative DNA primase/helicase